MKRKFTYFAVALVLLTFLAIPIGMRGQTRDVETFTFSELGYSNGDDVTTVEGDNVTLTFAQGEGNNPPKYYTTGTGVRMYTNNTLEVALNNQEGETRITAIDFTFSSTYTGSLQNWTGSETSVSFTNTASGQARIQVIAVTFSEGGVAPTTYTVTYNANVAGVAPVVDTYVEGANVTLRDANTFTNDGYTFSEWNTQADGDGDPFDAGDVIENIQANIELYAIWTENPVSDEQWVLTNLADLTSTDVFVIVGNGYAMTNNNGTSSAPATSAVTIEGSMITSTVAATIQWTISGDATNGYTFYPNGSTETWLYCNTTANSSSNNNIRVGTGNRKVFELNSNNYLMTKDEYVVRYLSIYNDADWRGYTNTNLCPELSFYKKVTGGVIPPSITAENVSIEYNVTSGSIAYTINNDVDGGAISAAVTEGDWLTLGEGTTSPISFTCSANEAGTERTATVTLTYTYNRATATANVTVTQAGNPNIVNNISDITAAGTYIVQGTIVAKSTRGFIVGDGTGYVYYYNTNYTQSDYNIGDIVRLAGSVVAYGGVFEFNASTTVTAATSSNYVTGTPTVLSGADMDARVASTTPAQLSSYVQYEGVLTVNGNYYNITNIAGATTAIGSISYPLSTEEITAMDGKYVQVRGYYVGISSNQYYNTMIESVYPIEAVILETYEIEVPAVGEEGNINVTYYNLEGFEGSAYFDVYFYAENGETSATYDWITAELDTNNNVHYVVQANEGDARTAYFKVGDGTEIGDVDFLTDRIGGGILPPAVNIYSDLVTVYQEAYVAPVASITIDPDFINLDATMHAVELLPLTYENLEITGLYNFTTQFYDAEGDAIEDPEWCSANVVPITNGDGYQVHIMTQANEGEVRSAYFKVYVLDANENPVYSNLVTINQAAPVIDYAVLPFVWEGGSSADFAALNGVTLSGNGSDYGSNNAPYLIKLDGTGDYIMVKTDSQPGIVTIGVKMIGGGNTSTITVQGSADGETFTDIEELTISGDQNDILTLETTNAFGDNDSYVKLLFTKGSNIGVGHIIITKGTAPSITVTPATLDLEAEIQVPSMDVTYHNLEITQANNFNVQFYDAEGEEQDMPNWIYYTNVSGPLPLDGSYRVFSMIMANDGPARSAYFKVYAYDADSIAVYSNLVTINQAAAQYTLTVEPFENLEMFTFVGEESEMTLEGAGSVQVAAGDNVMLSISALEGYEIASLMVDGEEHVQDIDESMVYLFDMPGHDVTISATAVEITPVTYTLATTIESGKTYIIVGSKTIDEETTYYAMGEQRNNNRGGVAISADGTTATVTSADVYEFVITALEDGFYSIYDDRTPGYLYAAAAGSNHLKTEPELDTVGNGNWEISIDEEGLFSIVASQSSNRNVMQFNYNGGSPLFSCYGSASQSPVYLYVKDETPSTVTQTIALIAGTNWISANVEITLADLQEALVAALPGTTITIKSKNQQTAYNGSRWRGQLNTLDLTQMYKVIVSNACEITLEGMPIDPAEHSITIEANNANWIAFPLGANMTVSNAFAGFAVNGDQIKYKDAQTAYNGSRWRGSLSNLVPGQGYIYISNSSENRVFVFPTSSKK